LTDQLAIAYTRTAEKLIGANSYVVSRDVPVEDMPPAARDEALRAAVTELAITRLALALACRDVSAGFIRRGGQNTLDPKPVPSAVTLTTEALP
jgi:hypothetical protein